MDKKTKKYGDSLCTVSECGISTLSDYDVRMKTTESLKRGSFTVEAAVIVPLSVFMIAILCGFCYFTHQLNWYKGAACESLVFSLQKDQSTQNAERLAKEHMEMRMDEAPLNVGETQSEINAGGFVKVSFKGQVIPDYFGDRLEYEKEEALMIINPVSVKRAAFILRGITGA